MKLAVLGAAVSTAIAQATASPPAPRVDLKLVAPSTHGRWTLRLTNASPIPVRIVADLRLLALDVTPRSSRTVHCELPEDMRPEDDVDRRLLVPPGRSYVEDFDPRLYCFGNVGLDAIAPGAIVVAHLGFAKATSAHSRLEVAPAPGDAPTFAGLARLDAPPIAVPDEPTAAPLATASNPSDATKGADPAALSLRLQGARAVDADSPNEAEVPVTLENRGPRSVTIRFRPESLSFDVEGPGGTEHCPWPIPPAATTVEALTTLAPHESATLDVLLASYCHGDGLAAAGLVFVRPSLDTNDAPGRDAAPRAFAGRVTAATPTLLRLRHPSRYRVHAEAPAPELEPMEPPALREGPQ
ncbi:MAG: hypothetical protein ABTD50_05900 [Polyangiaceae bacterium]|jgi:hypothetical protein